MRHRLIYALLWIYKRTLSPVFMFFGIRCRHAPTCSEYCAECVSRYGFWAGSWMGLARFIRCRPGGTSGIDPVPEPDTRAKPWTPWRYADWRGPRGD